MPSTALFVDLPNFYSHLLESKLEEPRELRDYFLYWFDFDRLAKRMTEKNSSVWVFYSGHRFGPSSNRVEGTYLNEFMNRTNALKGVTTRDVNIPGIQREPAKYVCENCKNEGIALWESEKGIDSSLTVHLFDTIDTWDEAYLLSGDADFVPVVSLLRRKGKIVIGAGFESASSALIRECYEYIDLLELFFAEDYLAYKIFKKGGICDFWMNSTVNILSEYTAGRHDIEFGWRWQLIDYKERSIGRFKLDEIYHSDPFYVLNFWKEGPLNMESRDIEFDFLIGKYPHNVDYSDRKAGQYSIKIGELFFQRFLLAKENNLIQQGSPDVGKDSNGEYYFKKIHIEPQH